MRALDIITKKRDGGELSKEEITFFIRGFTEGTIPDYQAAAWAMAVLLRGMSTREITDLTMAMTTSGKMLDLSDIANVVVDKHSTGGVGDKTTLVVQPVVAANGVSVGKMSGRGLSYTGGTLDKMESIPGYRADLTTEEFMDQLARIGLVLCGQTADLAPADGKLYALRDVTGTVPSIPLIASSVMSKKISAGAQAILLDVKVGVGAFMHSVDEAKQLAQAMVDIGQRVGRRTLALISDMNQPLGFAIGNALEVREAIDTLHGAGPDDFTDHCLEVAGFLLVLAGKANQLEDAKAMVKESIDSGSAWEKFSALVEAQGGDLTVIENPENLPSATYIEAVPSPRSGYVEAVHARKIGLSAMQLGAGREKKGDRIDYAVGIEVHHKVGDRVHQGEPLFTLHANHESKLQAAKKQVLEAHQISDQRIAPLPLFYDVIEPEWEQ